MEEYKNEMEKILYEEFGDVLIQKDGELIQGYGELIQRYGVLIQEYGKSIQKNAKLAQSDDEIYNLKRKINKVSRLSDFIISEAEKIILAL